MNDDIDAHYREASAHAAGQPAESTRRAILEAAAALAAQRAAADTAAHRGSGRAGSGRVRWRRPALFGTLAAAALAGLVVVPQFLRPDSPRSAALPMPPAPAVAPAPAAAPAPATAPAVTDTAAAERTDARGRPANSVVAALAAAGAAPRPPPADSMASPAARAALAPSMQRRAALLAQTGDINMLDSAGRTALLNAVTRGDEAEVNELLARGADPNLAAPDGTTPLRAALAGQRATIADALRRAGAR